jgi:DNA invertase Pin-like site-specific DNA recombinase
MKLGYARVSTKDQHLELQCWRRLKIDHFKGAVPIEN